MKAKRLLQYGLTLACVAAPPLASAQAQNYPSKPINFVVPFPPGGIFDFMSRAFAQKLQQRWGQPAVVENKAGAGGWLAIQAVQKAAPDGYTLMANGSITVDMPLFNKEARFKPGTDIQAVGAVFYAPYVMFTNTQVPAKNLREFIAHVKANPGKLNWAVAPNTGQHLDTYGFIKGNGLDMVIVPYQGGAANLRAVIGNEAQAYFGAAFGLEPQVKAGKITLLGVTSAGRFPLLPDVPSIKEAIGYDLDSVVEYGFFTTFGTPKAVVEKLEREIHEVMAKTDVKEQIEKQGYAMRLLTAEQWTQSMTREFARASAIAQAAGIKPE